MKQIIKSVVVVSAFCATSLASAASPDMLGSWSGTTNSTVFGNIGHFESVEHKEPRFLHAKITYVIDKQDGPNFAGYKASATHKEIVAGALRQDGRSGVMADVDGMMTFNLIGKSKMEICYSQATPASTAVSCGIYERK
jgi:hypothetical protein